MPARRPARNLFPAARPRNGTAPPPLKRSAPAPGPAPADAAPPGRRCHRPGAGWPASACDGGPDAMARPPPSSSSRSHQRGQVHVVQDHQHAHALVARQVRRHAQQLALMPGIQAGGRLVQQQVARLALGARRHTGSARARTARAAAHRPTVRDNGARADGWRRPAPASCPPAPPRPRAAARERGRRPSPPPRPRPGRSPAPVSAAARRAGAPAARAPCRTDPPRPGATRPRRAQLGGQRAQQRRLAGAVGAQQAHHFARPERQRHAVQHARATARQDDVFCGQRHPTLLPAPAATGRRGLRPVP